MKKNLTENILNNNSIDLISIIKKLLSRKNLIIKSAIIFFLVGCIIALTSPIIYKSEITFIPQTSDQSSSSAGISSLATIAGIRLNSDSSLDKYISPILYSKIIESDEFSIELFDQDIFLEDGSKIKLKDYLNSKSISFDPIGLIKKYLIDSFRNENTKTLSNDKFYDEYNFISNEEYGLVNLFKEKFSIEANKIEGYIKVVGTDKNPFVSTQIVNLVTKNLQSIIISLRTNKIKEQLEYSEKQYENKKKEFEILQNKLARFRDSNKNISTAVFMSELQKLESEYQLQENILLTLATEYNNNKIKLNKNTPIFSVIDEVSVPKFRSKPQRKLIVLIVLFLGLFSVMTYIIMIEDFLKNFINNLNSN